jgi:hypothetical protein
MWIELVLLEAEFIVFLQVPDAIVACTLTVFLAHRISSLSLATTHADTPIHAGRHSRVAQGAFRAEPVGRALAAPVLCRPRASPLAHCAVVRRAERGDGATHRVQPGAGHAGMWARMARLGIIPVTKNIHLFHFFHQKLNILIEYQQNNALSCFKVFKYCLTF